MSMVVLAMVKAVPAVVMVVQATAVPVVVMVVQAMVVVAAVVVMVVLPCHIQRATSCQKLLYLCQNSILLEYLPCLHTIP